MPVRLHAAALTDQGSVRQVNEDTVYEKIVTASDQEAIGLFIVADGVGGRLAGRAASYWAVETIKNSLADLFDYRDPRDTLRFSREELLRLQARADIDPDALRDRVSAAAASANTAVRRYSQERPEEARDAGSTLSMALVHGLQAYIANVGDSRTYVLREGRLHQITKDHSLVQRLIDEGSITAEERNTHPQRNLIFRSLGARETVEIDVFPVKLALGDYLLLCTDGLWEMVQSESIIANIVRESLSTQTACQRLVAAANAAGGDDNIGVVLVKVYE